MKFEVIDNTGKTVMVTSYSEYIPTKEQINLMTKAGYKFKMDGKVLSKKAIDDLLASIKKGIK